LTEPALIVESDAIGEIRAELGVSRVLLEVIGAARALNVEGLFNVRITEEFVLLQGVANEGGLIEIHAVFAVSALAPSAPIEHTTGVLSPLVAIKATMLRTCE
jgi:hypothetical protein